MKKSFHFLPLILASLFITSCTLMMEDFEVPEAERGVDEPYTIELPDDMGSGTYQLNEGVIPITSDMLGNIAQVEADSIIYFYNYVSEDELPKVGQYLAASCSRTIPHGLNHQVLSVEDVGGLYKVVTKHASVDEVYEELDFDINFEYDDPIEMYNLLPDSAKVDSLGFAIVGEELIDWSVFDGTNPALVRKRKRMRASTEDDFEDTKEDKADPISFSIDTRLAANDNATDVIAAMKNIFHGKLRDFLSKERFPDNFYCALKMEISTTRTMYAKRVKKKDYEISYTDTKSSFTLALEAGADKGVSFIEQALGKDGGSPTFNEGAGKYLEELMKGNRLTTYENLLEKIDLNKKFPKQTSGLEIEGFYVPIAVVGPVAIEFFIQPKFDFGASVNLVGGLAFNKTTITRSGYEVKEGKQLKIQKKIKDETQASVYIQGKGEISAEVGCNVGLMFSKAISTGVYGYVKAGGEATVNFEPFGEYKIANSGSYVRIFAELSGNVFFNVAPLGIELYEKKLSFPVLSLYERKWFANPQFKTGPVPGSITMNPNGATLKYELDEDKVGFLCPTYTPQLLIYKNAIDPSCLIATVDGKASVVKDRYNFEYFIPTAEYNKENIYIGVPHIESPILSMSYPDLAYMYSEPIPKTTLASLAQGETKELTSYADFEGYEGVIDGGGDGSSSSSYSDFVKYKFQAVVNVQQRGMMKGWGIQVLLTHPTKGFILNKKIPIDRKKSGTYTVNMSFITNYKPDGGSKEPINVIVTPYYLDMNDELVRDDAADLNLLFPYEGDDYESGTAIDLNLN